jgi:hypothetical protein
VKKKASLRILANLELEREYCAELGCHVVDSWTELSELAASLPDRCSVDFETEFVVVACRGECPTGGYSVSIVEGWVTDDELICDVELEDPPPNAFVTLAMTFPQAAAAVARAPFDGLPARVLLRESSSSDELAVVEVE